MKIIYEVMENGYVKKTVDEIIWSIPNDPTNSDYQAYLASLDA